MTQKILEDLRASGKAAREAMGITDEESAADRGSDTHVQELDSPEENQTTETEVAEESEQTETTEVAEESEDQNTETDDSQETSGEATGEEDSDQSGTTVYQQLNHIRSQKRETDKAMKTLLDAIGAEAPDKALEAISKLKENQPVSEAFQEFAKTHGIEDPKVLREMYNLFNSQTKREMQEAIAPLMNEVTAFKQASEVTQNQNAWNESVAHMEGEWKTEALPIIQETWKPDAEQAAAAQKLMTELAHSEKYHDKELGYILYKERTQFEAIMGAPKRKTLFSGRGKPSSFEKKAPTAVGGAIVKPDGTHDGILKARQSLQNAKQSSSFTEQESLN